MRFEQSSACGIGCSPELHILAQLFPKGAMGLTFKHSPSSRILKGDISPAISLASQDHLLVRTSGSSGKAKVIKRSAASWIASFETNRTLFDLTSSDVYAVLGGFETSLSLYAVSEGLHLGADILALGGQSMASQKMALAKFVATVLYATPTQLRILARGHSEVIASVRLILCGGGRLDAATRDLATKLFPNATFYEFFGAAETSFITLSDVTTPTGSVGRAYPHVEMELREGELWVKSPYLFDGYAEGNSNDTRWEDGFLSIGEMGHIEDGYLFLQGRKSRMVTVADTNIFPEDIEAVLATGANGRLVAAIPVEDAMRGNTIIAVIEGEMDAQLTQALVGACQQNLGALAQPKRIMFHRDFPVLGSGKPDLVRLAQWVKEQL